MFDNFVAASYCPANPDFKRHQTDFGYLLDTGVTYAQVAPNCEALGSDTRGLTFFQGQDKLQDFANFLKIYRQE